MQIRYGNVLILAPSLCEIWLKQKKVTHTVLRFSLLNDVMGPKVAISDDSYKYNHNLQKGYLSSDSYPSSVWSCLLLPAYCCIKKPAVKDSV